MLNMKLRIFYFLLILTIKSTAQVDSEYEIGIAKASLFHLQQNYEKAIQYFENAFQLKPPDALNAYKAAGVYSLSGNSDKAFHYLEKALSSGWTDADWLTYDPYFNYLKENQPDKWKEIEKKAFKIESQYEKSLEMPDLRKQINHMSLKDQRLRYERIQTSDSQKIDLIDKEIRENDLAQLKNAKKIIEEYGWPKISEIGKDGQNSLWLVIQHSDHDVLFQQMALAEMKKIKDKNEINYENYAFLYDRVQCNLNYKQLYGTQVVWTQNGEASGFRAIIKENQVDKRRKKLDLFPLKIYALTYGFKYNNISSQKAKQNDLADLEYTNKLMDSAKIFYEKKEFERVYDFYNRASMVMGGMDNEDNFEAAIIFAKIATINNEQKYKDISLDFLYLLYLRQFLNKSTLLEQQKFEILHNEERWKDILNSIEY